MNDKETVDFSYEQIMKKKTPPKQVSMNEICPLTPTNLYNVRVMPKTLDFGRVLYFIFWKKK